MCYNSQGFHVAIVMGFDNLLTKTIQKPFEENHVVYYKPDFSEGETIDGTILALKWMYDHAFEPQEFKLHCKAALIFACMYSETFLFLIYLI